MFSRLVYQWLLPVGITAMLVMSGSVVAQPIRAAVFQAHDEDLGTFLTDERGRPLYFAVGDEPNRPRCVGLCLQTWMPHVPSNASIDDRTPANPTVEVVVRADGISQSSYRGHLLYTYVEDTEPYTATGSGADDTWFVMNVMPLIGVARDELHGEYLVGPTGMTLYTFDYDPDGGYECDDACAENFPPLVVSTEHMIANPGAGPGSIGVIHRSSVATSRPDRRQITYNDKPLYYWSRDARPGDTGGEGIAGLWRIARP